MSSTTRMNLNGGADLGEMSFVWNMQSWEHSWLIQVEMSEGNLSHGSEARTRVLD